MNRGIVLASTDSTNPQSINDTGVRLLAPLRGTSGADQRRYLGQFYSNGPNGISQGPCPFVRGGGLNGATHSVYQLLWSLLKKLAAIFRHWLKSSNPRKDPGYINEAFQHLILQFIDHRTLNFALLHE
jgi:hypothetical protein